MAYSAETEWIRKMRLAEQNVRQLHSDLERISQDMQYVKTRNLPLEPVSERLHGLTSSYQKVAKEVQSMKGLAQQLGGPQGADRFMTVKRLEDSLGAIANRLTAFNKQLHAQFNEIKRHSSRSSTGRHSDQPGVNYKPSNSLQMQESVQIAGVYAEETYQRQLEHETERLAEDCAMLQEMWQQLHDLTHQQGEIVESIEARVDDVHMDVEAGHAQIVDANKKKKAAFRKKCICAIILVVVALVIVLVIVLAVVLRR